MNESVNESVNASGHAASHAARGGRVAAWWADRRLTTKGLVVVALPLLIFLLSVGLLRRIGAAEASAREDVRVTLAIQGDVQAVHVLLAEAASGVRGYLLTGEPHFLEAYRTAEPALDTVLVRLRTLMRDAEAARRLDTVVVLVAAEQRALATLVAEGARRAGDRTAASAARSPGERLALQQLQQALAANTRVFDALRRQIAAIEARERVLLAARQARAEATARRALALTVSLLAVGVAGSCVAVLLFSTGIVRRVQRLRASAARLGRGEPPLPFPAARDELGELADGMAEAGALLRAREGALRESEERMRLILEGAHDYGIFALDLDGRVVSWNGGAERIKGWRADEILGAHFSRFYPPEERATRPARNLAAARLHGRVEDEGWRVRRDGTRFFANVVLTALHDERGRPRGFVKITRDVTARHRAQAAVEDARREAEAASAAKSAFLSRMSHELRTPLNAILGFAQLLELDAARRTPDDVEAVAQILRAGRHLLGLIDEVLDIDRVERGDVPLTLAPTAVGRVVAEAVALTRPQARAAGVAVHVGPLPPDATAHADPTRLLQVLLNLLSNAIKYNRRGGRVDVTVEVTSDVTADVTAFGDGTPDADDTAAGDGAERAAAGGVTITVADTGIGVEPEHVPRLFTPFERVGRAARLREGTGLGLAVSRTLVRAMHGELAHAPRPDGGAGAVFRVALPRVAPAVAPHGHERPSASPDASSAASPDGTSAPMALPLPAPVPTP